MKEKLLKTIFIKSGIYDKFKMNNKFKNAFSIIEISIVILVMGILISGVSRGIDLYQDYNLEVARI